MLLSFFRITITAVGSMQSAYKFCILMLLLFSCGYSYSQDGTAPPDSITQEVLRQSNAQKIAMGQDTTPNLPEATVDTATPATAKVKPIGKRRFYWDSSKYPTGGDTSLAAKKLRRHSPLYAALFSAVLPGLGQAYNKKYWKIPIVYAGLGGLGYALYYTASNFTGYRNAYRAQVAIPADPFASYKGVSDEATLKTYRDYYKRSLDVTAICTGVFYILNIVDAAVDGHLFDWNMKDDIHLSWQPTMQTSNYSANAAPGVRLSLSF